MPTLKKWFYLPNVLRWLLISMAIGLLAGGASALFLRSLEWVTRVRESHIWIISILPFAGMLMALMYLKLGDGLEGGHNLLLNEIHDPKTTVPLRMAPMILLATLVSHLFGASVGREGTAVQMGGSLADQLSKIMRLERLDRRIVLMAGISAGFASVFGAPLAGAVFGLEVLSVGSLKYEAILPCFASAMVGSWVTEALGVHHEHYILGPIFSMSPVTFILTAFSGVLFGIAGMAFAQAIRALQYQLNKQIRSQLVRPLVGGAVLVLLTWFIGARYAGLGTATIDESFRGYVLPLDFAGKFLFTVIALGSGFKGGEVTPMFYIGATLGNTLSRWIALPTSLLSAVGFVAVFAGASNTPLACTLLAMEKFGSGIGTYAAIACVISYLFSGTLGIYHAQRAGVPKH